MLRAPGESRKEGNPSASQLLLPCLCFSQEMSHKYLNINPECSCGSITSYRTCSQIPDHLNKEKRFGVNFPPRENLLGEQKAGAGRAEMPAQEGQEGHRRDTGGLRVVQL